MTTTNGNGKRKKGQSAKDLGLLSLADMSVEEHPLADTNLTENKHHEQPDHSVVADTATESHQSIRATQTDEETPLQNLLPDASQLLEQTEQTAADDNPEELLRAARNSSGNTTATAPEEFTRDGTGDTASTPPKGEQKGEIAPRTTSQAIREATAKAAQNLVQANQQAAQERLQGGLREGYLDAKDFRQGWQIGFMKGVTDAKQKDSAEFLGQLERLRQHTDIEGGQDIDHILEKMGLSVTSDRQQKGKQQTKEETPLDIFSRLVDPSMPTDDETLNILDLAAQPTPLDPTQRASSPG